MLTSKLIIISLTWAMALIVSIFLRLEGIHHPDSFDIKPFLIWSLVFGPSLSLLLYFFLKRTFSFYSQN